MSDGRQPKLSTSAGRELLAGNLGRALPQAYPAVVAVLASILAFWQAPDLGTDLLRRPWDDFFTTCAQVIAALFIAVALEARSSPGRSPTSAVATIACLTVGEVAAVAALTTSLPDCLYRCLFALTVGGGLGALVAAVTLATSALRADREELRRQGGQRFLDDDDG